MITSFFNSEFFGGEFFNGEVTTFPVISRGFGIYGVSFRRKVNNELEVQIDERVDRAELRKVLEKQLAGPSTSKVEVQGIELKLSKRDLDSIIAVILASEL